MNDDALNLDAVPAAAVVDVVSPGTGLALAAATLAIMAMLIAGSVTWALRTGAHGKSGLPRFADLVPSVRLLCVLVTLSLLLVQGLAGVDVYVQTRVAQGSAGEYFHYLSLARLLGTSHSHVFGYAVTYGVLALMAGMTSLSQATQAWLTASILWAGLFDVLSWWGIKYVSPEFEWLAGACGVVTVVASLVVATSLVRSFVSRREEP